MTACNTNQIQQEEKKGEEKMASPDASINTLLERQVWDCMIYFSILIY